MRTPTEVAGRYRLDSRLGAGGMSTVFLAIDRVLERSVAVKLLAEHLTEDDAFVARFRREALAAAKLQHPNIVQVFDSGEDPDSGRHFIVMEYVDGPSCADLLREHSTLDVEQAVRYVRDACHGLDYAHRAGLVHRDVKPGNLLVSSETGSVKLADFGIAKAAEQSPITQVGSVLGTAAYLSPEQARGETVSGASDIYSLGVCAYQFLAGRLPHEYGSITELAVKQQSEGVEPISAQRPEVPAALDRAVRVCLEPDPAARYSSALELSEALAAGLQGEDTEPTRQLAAAELGGAAAVPAADETLATQALRTRPTGGFAPPPSEPHPYPAHEREERPRKKRRPGAYIAATLAILLAAAAIWLAVDQASNDSVDPVVEDSLPDQVQGLKDLIREHSN